MLKKLLFSLTFLALATVFGFAQITSVGIIGSATPNGWDMDIDMTQNATDPDVWEIFDIMLTTGEAKFRANDDWAINWGDPAFPTGTGTQDGNNIQVPGGTFDVSVNVVTGDYSFTFKGDPNAWPTIGIIGTATPGAWDDDTDMTQVANAAWVWEVEMTLTEGEAKFRANDAWDDNWGSTDFPAGVGTAGGDNIAVTPGGDYYITFNTATLEYNFAFLTPTYSTIGLIGDATPGGWTDDTDLTQNPNNVEEWSGNIMLVDGGAKFRAEDDWAVNWGDTLWNCGIGVQDGDNIPAVAGEYNVKFNSTTGVYCFDDPIAVFDAIGVIGSGTALGWDEDIDMCQDPAQPDQWRVQLKLNDGELKFRANDAWDINWGDTGFPTGTGTQGGDNIPVFAGTWQIDFNATTGVYSFTPVTVGIIGTALAGGWDSDEDLDASNSEGSTWTVVKALMDGEAKFRQDDDWAINWGLDVWPAGVGVQDGPNIPITAGTYEISINTCSGEYSFMEGDATSEVLSPNFVKVFPNPTSGLLNISIETEEMQRDITIRVMDLTGKVMSIREFDSASNISLDVSEFNTGLYILQISNEQYVIGKRFTVAK